MIGLPIVLLAASFWVFAEIRRKKAVKAEETALLNRDNANKDLVKYVYALTNKKDSLEKDFLKKFQNKNEYLKEIKRLNDTIEILRMRINNSTNIPVGEDEEWIKALNERIETLKIDSISKDMKIKQNRNLISTYEADKEFLVSQIDKNINQIKSLEDEKEKLNKIVIKFNQEIVNLNITAVKDAETIRILRDSVSRLRGQIRKLGETIEDLINRNPGSMYPGNLRIQVYDKEGEFKVPITKDTFLVYIIPDKGKNEDILDDNNVVLLSKECDAFNKLIPKLYGWQKAYFRDGYYYFHDVIQNGKYKVKICNILDGYFDLHIPSPSGEVYWRQNDKQKISIKLGKF